MDFDFDILGKVKKKYTFYYDETGNCRKFYLNNGKVNYSNALEYDFILGGVVFDNEIDNCKIEKLFKDLKLQHNQEELKLKHIGCKSSSFIDKLNNERMTIILDWILSNNVYIHFAVLNNLYYALADIVDSLIEINNDILFYFIPMMKDSLYKVAKTNINDFLEFLSNHNYPNVSDNKNFCDGLIERIKKTNSNDEFLNLLCIMLQKASNKDMLVFLNKRNDDDSEAKTLIDEYYMIYYLRCIQFISSRHYFDEEDVVEEKIDLLKKLNCNIISNNYQFVNSKNNKYIQLSDVIVGVLGKLLYFIDNIKNIDIQNLKSEKYSEALNNLRKVKDIIFKSNEECEYFIQNINSGNVINDRMKTLVDLCK